VCFILKIQSRVYGVLVMSELDVVTEAIRAWSASHSHADNINILLNAIGWDTHSYQSLSFPITPLSESCS
jgi:hypothetical protein